MWLSQRIAAEVIEERQRQVNDEGFSTFQDDHYGYGILSSAGACYALEDGEHMTHNRRSAITALWPFQRKWWKPKDRRRNLIRAMALIMAEVECLDRAAERKRVREEQG